MDVVLDSGVLGRVERGEAMLCDDGAAVLRVASSVDCLRIAHCGGGGTEWNVLWLNLLLFPTMTG